MFPFVLAVISFLTFRILAFMGVDGLSAWLGSVRHAVALVFLFCRHAPFRQDEGRLRFLVV
jgi:hypothetical protein